MLLVLTIRILLHNRARTHYCIILPALETSVWAGCSALHGGLLISVGMNVALVLWSLVVWVVVVAAHTTCAMTCMSRSVTLSIVHLEYSFLSSLKLLSMILVSIILDKLFYNFLTFVFLVCGWSSIHATLLTILIDIIWIGLRSTSYIWICMVIFLNLFSDSSTTHEAFFVWVFLIVVWCLIIIVFVTSIEVLTSR